MMQLTDERWKEIRELANAEGPQRAYLNARPPAMKALKDVLQQHDHLAAQIKLLADYIMSERSDDPAWSLSEGACARAIAIMGADAIAYKALQEHKNALVKENQEMNETLKWVGEGYDDKFPQTICETCQNTRRILAGSLLETVPCPDCMGRE